MYKTLNLLVLILGLPAQVTFGFPFGSYQTMLPITYRRALISGKGRGTGRGTGTGTGIGKRRRRPRGRGRRSSSGSGRGMGRGTGRSSGTGRGRGSSDMVKVSSIRGISF